MQYAGVDGPFVLSRRAFLKFLPVLQSDYCENPRVSVGFLQKGRVSLHGSTEEVTLVVLCGQCANHSVTF